MHFKNILFYICFGLHFFSQSTNAADETPSVQPLGIVIRPNLVRKLIEQLNQIQNNNQNISFEFCLEESNAYFAFGLNALWSDPKWINLSSSRAYIQAKVASLRAIGKYIAGCQIDPVTKKITVTALPPLKFREATLEIANGNLGILFEPQKMDLKIDRTEASEIASKMTLKIPEAPRLTEFFNSTSIREAILNKIFDLTESTISSWLTEKLRGLSFIQSAGEVLKDNPIWKTGPLVQRSGVTLELAEPSPSQQYLTFAFNPFRTNSFFTTSNGLELYFNATFLNADHLKALSGLEPTAQNSEAVMEHARKALQNKALWTEGSFDRPILSASDSDFSLVIPTTLTNSAWGNFYQQRLLSLRLTVDIGKQTKGLIAAEEQNVSTVITINPQSAPKMTYEANRFKLDIENYVMNVGTHLEDRTIPSTQIQSHLTIAAALKVDPVRKMMKMALDPSQFELKLKDIKGRLSDEEVALFEHLAKSIWTDFFKQNSEFEIFPTVFDPENLHMEIQNVTVSGASIVLDLSIALKGDNK
ncbi:MAG: hypothetical protein JWQ35_426 [Bacteriovoracaceae bacterium]|nr:hypothetical protein [Bacteriovoracaceae bacterium]